MTRTISLKSRNAAEWVASVPSCCRCGQAPWLTWLTKLDSEWAFVCDPCLTPDERRAWVRAEETPKGKVNVPVQ